MRPSLDLMPVPPRWQLSCPAGTAVPPHSRMARGQPGQESNGQERQPRPQSRKAALSSGLVQSRLLSCPRHKGEASGQTVHVSRQVNDLPRHVIDLAGGGRKGLRGSRTSSRPESICGKSVANRLRVDPPSLSDLLEHVYLQRVFVEPPRGFEPRTYALRAVRRSPGVTFLLVHTPAYPALHCCAASMFRGIPGSFRESSRRMRPACRVGR